MTPTAACVAPLRTRPGSVHFLGDIATPRDTHLIQLSMRAWWTSATARFTSSDLPPAEAPAALREVVDDLRAALPGIEERLSRSDVKLEMVMDQSVYVRQSISSLVTEGVLGAPCSCSLVILFVSSASGA